jgi:hypothetical protein
MRMVSRQFGTNVIDRDWDVLLILDAASFEIMSELQSEFDYVEECSSIWSRGSSSPEWAQNTFIEDDRDLSDLHYVTGNALTSLVAGGIDEKEIYRSEGTGADKEMIERYIENGDEPFKTSHEVWLNQYDYEDSMDVFFINPDVVTKKATEVIQDSDDRVIVHYMQPHEPFIEAEERYDSWPYVKDYDMFNMSDEDYNGLMNAYEKNHRYILDKVKLLLSNIDNELDVVMTSDHANIYGQLLGINYAFGHPQYVWFNRNVRKVPYMKVDQSIVNEDVDIKVEDEGEVESDEVVDRLEALGYK